jgi:hypothetical protein
MSIRELRERVRGVVYGGTYDVYVVRREKCNRFITDNVDGPCWGEGVG